MSEADTSTTQPGWYQDGHGAERWWDGGGWTEHTRRPAQAIAVPESTAGGVVDRKQQKLADREQKAAQREEERKREQAARDAAAFAASPVGQARAAFERGDEFFQFEIEVSRLAGSASAFGSSGNAMRQGGRPDLLGQIEGEGFRLEHVGYVFIETGATSTNRVFSTGQGTVTRGMVQGIYLFRRHPAGAEV